MDQFPVIYLKIPKNERDDESCSAPSNMVKYIKYHLDRWFFLSDINCNPMYNWKEIVFIFDTTEDFILFKLAWL